MSETKNFEESVALRFQLFNGMFTGLPFDSVRATGITLPLFVEYIRNALADGVDPDRIIHTFFQEHRKITSEHEVVQELSRILQFVERQVVLFDAIEDAAFLETHDMHDAGSLKHLHQKVQDRDARVAYAQFLEEFSLRVVLTAHPTQFYTNEVLGILTDLYNALKNNEVIAIREYLMQLGQTPFRNRDKPTPLEEAAGLMWILEHVMYSVVPAINEDIFSPVCDPLADEWRPVVELGFWPGGDRDGNPYVNSAVTLEVARMLRNSVLTCYLEDVSALQRRLTFPTVTEVLKRMESRLRSMVQECSIGVVDTDSYAKPDDLLTDITVIHRAIAEKHQGLFIKLVEQLYTRVRSFGFHFATLDIRQDSRVHAACVKEIWRFIHKHEPALPTDPERIIQYLQQQPRERVRQWAAQLSEELTARDEVTLADCISTILVIEEIQKENGEFGCHRYIISNTRCAEDVLNVWLIAAFGGLNQAHLPLDITPLFETIPDLHASQTIMSDLYHNRLYRDHVRQRGDRQVIMLGFSDGTKDGGYVTANWEIYKAKEQLSATTTAAGIRAEFFDGRGGPPARGGGNTHRFYRSLGKDIEGRTIQLTIQGQTITSLYGTEDSARYNLEKLVSAGIENSVFPDASILLTTPGRSIMEKVSEHSFHAYNALKEHPQFVSYLEEMTPLRHYGKAKIGSRPAKRGGKSGKTSLDALRAIPFVGSWGQVKQNVPGYFGFGTALAVLRAEGFDEDLRNLYKTNLFFQTLVENSMQSLAKTYFPLTKYQENDPDFGSFWRILHDEYQKTIQELLAVSGQSRLLTRDRNISESIKLRERMVLPAVVIQQYALQQLRMGNDEETYTQLVVKSLAASINAGRNVV